MVNSKGVGVINPSNEIVNKFDLREYLRLLSIKNDWDDRACVRRKYLRNGVIDGKISCRWYFAAQQLVLLPLELFYAVPHRDGTLRALATSPQLNVASDGFSDISYVNRILEPCSDLSHSRGRRQPHVLPRAYRVANIAPFFCSLHCVWIRRTRGVRFVLYESMRGIPFTQYCIVPARFTADDLTAMEQAARANKVTISTGGPLKPGFGLSGDVTRHGPSPTNKLHPRCHWD
jgi:hypothetical protein